MTFWIRATTYAMVPTAGGHESAVLVPGEAVPYALEHDGIIADLQAGRDVPVELIESESDPSLPPPEPDEVERQRERVVRDAQAKAATHERLLRSDPAADHAAALERLRKEQPTPTPTPEGVRS